jgi:hypothetical protein
LQQIEAEASVVVVDCLNGHAVNKRTTEQFEKKKKKADNLTRLSTPVTSLACESFVRRS